MERETFEAIRDQAARDGRCLYIASEEEGKRWFCAGGMKRLHMVFADTDPYISIAACRAYEPGVLVDEEDGRLVLWECTPGAFADLYQGWQCSLYALPEALFLKEPTNWKTTRVCTDRAPVVHEEKIADAWNTLAAAARDGLCSIHEYTDGEEYKNALERISERIRIRNEKPLFIIDDDTLVQYVAEKDDPVEEVVIPDGVKVIGRHAFYDAWWVESVRIPDSVRVIEEEAFYGCTFDHIEIPEGVTTIEKWAFGACANLDEVRIPDSVTSIGPWAFGYRRNLHYYNEPEAVNRHVYHSMITLIGEKGGVAQRYADDNKWYDCCLIAEFREG